MLNGTVTSKHKIRSGTKVKTGCATCRIRKVKCDEAKPYCRRCVDTGRTCDGYNSVFRSSGSLTEQDTVNGVINPIVDQVSPEEIDLLNHIFSIKTVFDVNLCCDEEAKQVLQASLTNPIIRHAVSALRALREDFDEQRIASTSGNHDISTYNYGLQQYTLALRGLVSSISSPGTTGLKSALLCCQIFISIEQVQMNFSIMAQHIIRGLRILRESHLRPGLTEQKQLILAHPDQLPPLDIFVIKLFAAPCKFEEPSAIDDKSESVSPSSTVSPSQLSDQSSEYRAIAPNMRTELTSTASSVIGFLGQVSQVQSVEGALQLLPAKVALLNSLESWLTKLELGQAKTPLHKQETVSVSFLRILHLIVKIVLLGALDYSPGIQTELRSGSDGLQHMADNVDERLKDFKAHLQTRSRSSNEPQTR